MIFVGLLQMCGFLTRSESGESSGAAEEGAAGRERSKDERTAGRESHAGKMGFLGCTSYVIGNVIGSGVFIAPTDIVRLVNSVGLSLAVWIACGLVSLLGTVVYVELGTSIREPGCDFAYVCYVKWLSPAFAFMWVGVWLTFPSSSAVQARTFGVYVVEAFTSLYDVDIDDSFKTTLEMTVSIAILALMVGINFFSITKIASKFQLVVTIAKLGAIAVVIGIAVEYLIQGDTENLKNVMEGSNSRFDNFLLAFYAGLWSYAGWDILNYGVNEINNPARNMPLSLYTGIAAVTAIYTAVNVAFFVVLSVDEITTTGAIAAAFSAAAFGFGKFSFAIPLMVAMLVGGTLNSNIFCASRFMYAAAREHQLPSFFSCINRDSGSPRVALLVQGLLAAVMLFVDVSTLIGYVSFVMFFQKIVTMLALMWIRYKRIPVHPEAIRVPLVFTVLFLLVNVVLLAVALVDQPFMTLIGSSFLASGVLIYWFCFLADKLPQWFTIVDVFLVSLATKLLKCEPNVKPLKEGISPIAEDLSTATEAQKF